MVFNAVISQVSRVTQTETRTQTTPRAPTPSVTRTLLMQICAQISKTFSVDVDFESARRARLETGRDARRLDDTWVSLLLPPTWPHLGELATRENDRAH